mmetsp:Transcript_11228/g.21122  ORF Transcript_11228/g.21122 Transcript_11228/m.21122 type:complete len:251 (-) Transcript_11228:26-778(-)
MDAKLVTDIFRRFDKNRDGIISKEELLAVLSRISLKEQDMTQMLKHIDANGDGKIQYDEFVHWILGAGCGDGSEKERATVVEMHAQAAVEKVKRVRASQTGASRAEVFVTQLVSPKGRASLEQLAEKPPKGALAVCTAVHSLLWISSKKIEWPTAKQMLSDLDGFLERLESFDPARIPDYVVQSYQQTLELPYFDFNRMVDTNYALACLSSWVLASTCSVKEAKQLAPWEDAALRAKAAVEALQTHQVPG